MDVVEDWAREVVGRNLAAMDAPTDGPSVCLNDHLVRLRSNPPDKEGRFQETVDFLREMGAARRPGPHAEPSEER